LRAVLGADPTVTRAALLDPEFRTIHELSGALEARLS